MPGLRGGTIGVTVGVTSPLDRAVDDAVLPVASPILDWLNLSAVTWLQITVTLYSSTLTSAWTGRFLFSLLCFLGSIVATRYIRRRALLTREDAAGASGLPAASVVSWYDNLNTFLMTTVMNWVLFEKIRAVPWLGGYVAYAFTALVILAGSPFAQKIPLAGALLPDQDVLFAGALALLVYSQSAE